MTSNLNIEKIKEVLLDYKVYAEKFLKIRNKRGEIVPFRRNWAQKKLYETTQRLISEGKPPRIIILKARQIGFSTETEAEIFFRTATQFNRRAVIVAQDREASDNLFTMFKTFYSELPAPLRPKLKKNNEKKLEFGALNSSVRVLTAENREKLGRSATIQDLHASEVAFWADADRAMLALLQTAPDELNTLVIAESTANGIGGWFYDTFQDAVEGRNDWVPLFFAWHENPEYRRAFASGEEKQEFIATLDDYEKMLRESYGLDYEQINWYRYTLRNKAKGDRNYMFQEYPSSAQEAFVASGNPVFDQNICMRNYKQAKEPILVGEVGSDGKFWKHRNGRAKLFYEPKLDPKEHNRFVAGVDVAEGKENGDYSVVKVLDRKTWEVVLTWRGHIDPDLFAKKLLYIQNYFGKDIWFEIEKNNHGLHVIIEAFKLGVNIKYSEEFKKGYATTSHQGLGFVTNVKTKPLIIDNLNMWIREGYFTDNDKVFWEETFTFVRDEKGAMNAQQGKHDDEIIAMALAINASLWLPSYYREKEKEPTRIPEAEIDAEVETLF